MSSSNVDKFFAHSIYPYRQLVLNLVILDRSSRVGSSRVEEEHIGYRVPDRGFMWNASDADCRMRYIGTNHDLGIRCRPSVRQVLSNLRSYLPLVNSMPPGPKLNPPKE